MEQTVEQQQLLQAQYIESIRPKIEKIESVLEFNSLNKIEEILTVEWGAALAALVSELCSSLNEDKGYSHQFLETAYTDFLNFCILGFSIGHTMGKGPKELGETTDGVYSTSQGLFPQERKEQLELEEDQVLQQLLL